MSAGAYISMLIGIFIARGGRPSEFKHHRKSNSGHEPLPESENGSTPAMWSNSPVALDPICLSWSLWHWYLKTI